MKKQQLIEDNMNLVYALVSREYPTYLQDEDIIQTGMLGLCMAADKWDESKAKFSSFAYSCIRNAILNEFRRRNKHQGVLSLDYEITGGSGEKAPFSEFVVGEEDVTYVDDCSNQLTPLQAKIMAALKRGMTPKEVAKAVGTTTQNVYFTQRKVRILREQADRKG